MIINGDSRDLNNLIGEDVVFQTTITSPPYYDMKDYGVVGQIGFGQKYEDYLNDLTDIFRKIREHTAEDGSLWIIIDTFKRKDNIVLLPFDIANRLTSIGWFLQNVIIWKKDKTVPWSSGSFVQRKFEYILFFSKNSTYKSYGDRVRIYDKSELKKWWIKYPERYNPKGKALGEIWEYPIPVQGSWGKQYIRHFCPLPKEMVATMIAVSTDEDDCVFDPFSGSGTVPSQAAYMNRRYIGIELNPEYARQSQQYIDNTIQDGFEEYRRLVQHVGQDEFMSTIMSLRALKYGRILLNKVEKQFGIVGKLKIIVCPVDLLEGRISYTIIGVIDKSLFDYVSQCISKAPLSKFGIIPQFIHKQEIEVPYECRWFYYSRTNSHKYMRRVKISSNKVAVISNICVDIND